MQTNTRRIALLTGVSVAALGAFAPAPAEAAITVTANPGINHPAAGPSDLLTIDCIDFPSPGDPGLCGVAVTGTTAGPYGVIANGVFGNITQTGTAAGATLDLTMTNTGNNFVGGLVDITVTGGNATGGVTQFTATQNIVQAGANADIINLTIDNSGTLGAGGVATVNATAGSANAFVRLQNGVILQSAAVATTANLLIENTGDLDVMASANAAAAGTGNAANASATMDFAVLQIATNVIEANLDFNNAAGTFAATATAVANATDGPAAANATLDGVAQVAIAVTDANVTLDNDASFTVHAGAIANGTAAVATASADYGVLQIAVADAALASVTNAGAINIGADANANAGTAGVATANAVADGVIQIAIGGTTATAVYNNSAGGRLDVDATATATGAVANANASVSYALAQVAVATGTGGVALADLNNGTGGAIDADARAIANGGTSAFAFADVDDVVFQLAVAPSGNAAANVNNGGLISGQAFASASDAVATATVGSVIQQIAIGGIAVATVTNSGLGTITGSAVANAFGPGGNATANADIGVVIDQSAFASGIAVASVSNSGLIGGLASANANAFSVAVAAATVATGIDQLAFVSATGIAAAAVANNTGGTMSFGAFADAGGTTVGVTTPIFIPATTALAFASVAAGIDQTAIVFGNGIAAAGVANSGSLTIIADADAAASSVAIAAARVDDGIEQNAAVIFGTAAAIAAVAVTNAAPGAIAITADASAVVTGATGFAGAYASVETGIDQEATAVAGSLTVTAVVVGPTTIFNFNWSGDANAAASVTNSGSLTIDADAFASATGATAVASAIAFVDDGIQQDVVAVGGSDADALASVTNALGAPLVVSADATAVGGLFAVAAGTVETGIDQEASAFVEAGTASATAALANAGTLTIAGNASAVAASSALAVASVGQGINQSAFASGFGIQAVIVTPGGTTTAFGGAANAAASLANTGSLAITAEADATGGSAAAAFATITTGIEQDAFARGATGANAAASLANGATMTISADAAAIATGAAFASAFVGDGVDQSATALGVTGTTTLTFFGPATANANMTNTGTYVVNANASALGGSLAVANAFVSSGIDQNALAIGTVASAGVGLTNSGAIDIGATAFASATTLATAFAGVGNGIEQEATATGTASANAAASLSNSNTIDVTANASAIATGIIAPVSASAFVSGQAVAVALIGDGIDQEAAALAVTLTTGVVFVGPTAIVTFNWGGTASAAATLTNSGTINVAADAFASAATATAVAGITDDGIDQNATATGGSGAVAAASLSNAVTGVINVSADASAQGINVAVANASVSAGIEQGASAFAFEGTASAAVSLTNAGAIAIGAEADATATGATPGGSAVAGAAVAIASVGVGVSQSAFASGFGVDTIVFGTTTTLVFFAGSANASANMSNTGSLSVTADASANGGGALAIAGIGGGVFQGAGAFGASAATATASFTNTGPFTVTADATAIGTAGAAAIAGVGFGLVQVATAAVTTGIFGFPTGTANAAVNLSNTSAMNIGASAFASAGTSAFALAGLSAGIFQVASAFAAAGTASANLVNSGVINIGVDASATALSAVAIASMGVGVGQLAFGADQGIATLNNSGSLSITAEADAGNAGTSTFAGAGAFIGTGVLQVATAFATGGVATASIVNTGPILIAANADGALASDGAASASAVIGAGFVQIAAASSAANVSLVNDSTIDVLADAVAIADEDGVAVAGISQLVFQSASAFGTGGDASVALTNNSSLIADANATVFAGNDVFASAFVGGIIQLGFGGTTGTANVSLANNGLLSITADASAIGGGTGSGFAFASGGVQIASAGAGATASLVNTATITVAADADVFVGNAAQKGASAAATAIAGGWFQSAAAVTTTFTGAIAFTAAFPGTAVTSDTLAGVAFVRTFTVTSSPGGPALASVENTGSISITADASAIGDDLVSAVAIANAFTQVAVGDPATAVFVNGPAVDATTGGTLTVAAAAFASGDNSGSATAIADAIDQTAIAAQTVVQFVTAGTGTIHLATTIGGGFTTVLTATADSAQRTLSIEVTPTGVANAIVVNSGVIDVSATATAIVNGNQGPVTQTTAPAFALAIGDGIDQYVSGDPATATVDNSGSLIVSAAAAASGATNAAAVAIATGVSQTASAVAFNLDSFFHLVTVTRTDGFGHITTTFQVFTPTGTPVFSATNVGLATVNLDNSGLIDVDAAASAVAGSAASAAAFAAGAFQNAFGTSANANAVNSATIDVFASAFASGTSAVASAGAIGLGQFLAGTAMNATFSNTGELLVEAFAQATGPTTATVTGAAFASAIGYQVVGAGGGTLNVDVFNSGSSIIVGAGAVAPGTAVASALGIGITNLPTITAAGTLGNPVSGNLTNAGLIDVLAFASGGGTFTTPTTGGGTTTVALSSANATGIAIFSGVNTMDVTNTGVILVDAIVANGGNANATGLLVAANGTAVPLVGDVFTFTNDGGTIIVRESVDDGATFRRGMAIDVSAAANNSVINLLGDGYIYGNIDVQTGDQIFVENGLTVFDGIINPECMPPVYDDPAVSACGQGTLTIQNDGELYLVDGNDDPTMNDGPSYVFVNTFNMGDTGTIWYELHPTADGGDQPIGTYPQVFADVANLDGTLIADITLATPLPADSYFWNNVIDANVRNGVFDECIILGFPGPGMGSLFLEGGCIYDSQANVDIGVERIGFDEIDGLTPNQLAVAGAIEAVYVPTLTGPFGNLVLQLFNFEDGEEAAYADALDMLSGVEYPNYLHAVRNNTFVLNSFVSDQIDCAIHIRGIEECRNPETRGRIWVKGTYNSAELDGNSNFIGYEADSWSAMLGGDLTFGHGRIGAFIGYRDIDVDYPDAVVGSKIDSNGLQVGLYGAYDVGSFYGRVITSYSWLSGDSERRIQIFDINTTARGEPDVNVWSLYAEAGGRFDVGGSWVTPYVALDHTSMRLKGFTETDGAGAGLQIDSQTESQTSGLIGIKWAGNWDGIIPEAKLAYRHDFSGDLGVDMRFADAPPGSDFRKEEAYKEGSIIAGLSLAGTFGSNLMGRIGYQGRFNSEVTDHAVYGVLTWLFGAPPPPPPPPAPPPPPPPPPPATQTCPDGTVILATEVCPAPPPPPPPPPPAPERG